MHLIKKALVAISLFFAVFGLAHAAPSYCNNRVPGDNPLKNDSSPVLSTSDMTYNNKSANDCYGHVANDNDTVSDINALAWGNGWLFAARDNIGSRDRSNTVLGIAWNIIASEGDEGSWTLTGVDRNGTNPANLGDTFDFVGVLKGGNGWAAYLFDNVVFDGSDGGTYAIEFFNKGGKIPDLSHLSIYAREGGKPTNDVPEPGTLALAGFALLGLALTGRRQRQQPRLG